MMLDEEIRTAVYYIRELVVQYTHHIDFFNINNLILVPLLIKSSRYNYYNH